MGNENGMMDAVFNCGKNKVLNFNDGYFSFAFGNEIALCINENYYILNCDSRLWERVKELLKTKPTLQQIKSFWKKQSKSFEISDWSNSFSKL